MKAGRKAAAPNGKAGKPAPGRLLLVDGPAHLYRAFYAIRPLTDPRGRPVNAVYGFAQILLNLLDRLQPEYGVVAFDTPEPTFRHRLFTAYKAQREEMPEDLGLQFPLVKEMVRAMGFFLAEKSGWEADDIIGTLAARAHRDRLESLIFTTDKDAFQLVEPGVTVLRPVRGGQGEVENLDAEGVRRVFGVAPEQVVEVLALMGDASDNVPGVRGVGPKTAMELIRNFGSLERVYASLAQIPQDKLRERLVAQKAEAELSRRLVIISRDVPLKLEWEQCRLPAARPAAAYRLLAEMGFKSLLPPEAAEAAPAAGGWAAGLSAEAPLAPVLSRARETGTLAVELLPAGMSFAAATREAAWLSRPENDLPDSPPGAGDWRELLGDGRVTKVGYDLKSLRTALLRSGQDLRGPLEDLHLVAHLLDLPDDRPDDFVARVLGAPPPPDQPGLLACADLMLVPPLLTRLQTTGVEKVYREIEMPLLPVLAEMEARGVAIDREALNDMGIRLGLKLRNLEEEIRRQAGVDFNVRSTQQLAEVLFERLRLAPGRKTKTGRSTSVEVLEALAADHPLPALILEYRQLQKLKSTYLDVLPSLVDPRDQRLHTTFHQVGAATGRLSSSDPNLQNIPIRTELGRELRRAFVPGRPGHALLSADYSQIELRLLAHLSGDEHMLADFAAGQDIHRATAAEIFQVPPEAVTAEMRRQAKTCNFGIAYGVSPFGLARQLKISPARGREFIERFFTRYPRVRGYLDGTLEQARQSGFVTTLLGRRRGIPDIRSANRNIREAAERMAINAPLQGSAADLIKLAMIRLDRELQSRGLETRMILQVHDELVCEGPAREMPEVKELAVRTMSGVLALRVELVVDAAWGRNWMEAHG